MNKEGAMALGKTLETGSIIRTWNYDTDTMAGQTIGVKNNATGIYDPLVHVESVQDKEGGTVNRIVIKKERATALGWQIIEE